MLINSPENRKVIAKYLEEVTEDDFITDFVIPFFSSVGYIHYRTNNHGPGEHGKDLIFCQSRPIFLDNEYVVVQAKADPMTASKVSTFADQMKRAINTKITIHSGGGTCRPNYGILVNARKHTNDADEEFYQLLQDNPNVKKLSQENVCDLMMRSGIYPARLQTHLMEAEPKELTNEDVLVFNALMDGDPARIEDLLERQLPLIKIVLAQKTRHMVIDYIFNLWSNDSSWSGTVKPMRWLNKCFELIQSDQNGYLLKVFRELTSSMPSFAAQSDTYSVAKKVTPAMLSTIREEFIHLCADVVLTRRSNYRNIPIGILRGMVNEKLIPEERLRDVEDIIVLSEVELSPAYREQYERVQRIAFSSANTD